MDRRAHFQHIKKAGLPLILLAGLAACTPAGGPDHRTAFPITAKKVTFALDVKVAEDGAIPEPEIRKVRGFVREYLRRARTPIVINQPSAAKGGADNGTQQIRQQLLRNGISDASIAVKPVTGDGKVADRYILSFNGFAVQVPKCGDWSGESGFNPSGLPHRNFGCSYQRNIGLMLVDPGDLIAPRPEGLRTARETDRVTGAFRAGKPTESEKPEGVSGSVSGVGKN